MNNPTPLQFDNDSVRDAPSPYDADHVVCHDCGAEYDYSRERCGCCGTWLQAASELDPFLDTYTLEAE